MGVRLRSARLPTSAALSSVRPVSAIDRGNGAATLGVKMFRVMIVDDEETYRRLVRAMLETEDDFQVLGEASSGTEAVELKESLDADLILMDVVMPDMSGFKATRLMLKRHLGAKVILISRSRRQKEYARLAEEAGALAFVPKSDLSVSTLREILQS